MWTAPVLQHKGWLRMIFYDTNYNPFSHKGNAYCYAREFASTGFTGDLAGYAIKYTAREFMKKAMTYNQVRRGEEMENLYREYKEKAKTDAKDAVNPHMRFNPPSREGPIKV